jgi:GDP-4-dehydro-6-deoxy-D-mannose reductase
MKALVIGAAGFVGKHLVTLLKTLNWQIFATRLHGEIVDNDVPSYDLDILDPAAISSLLEKIKPDCIFHLAAQSSVALSWEKPALTVDVNIKGAVYLLEAMRNMKNLPRILLIGSGEEYGYVLPTELPIHEETLLRPGNVYALTKVAQSLIGQIYSHAYGIEVVIVRAFNHIGPGQLDTFAVSGFCKQVAEIEAGIRPPVIQVGNLSAKRDFTDVRDIVKAYSLLIEKGKGGEIYNVGRGKAIPMREILTMILSLSVAKISIEQDDSRLRPLDTPVIEADISRLTELTGWIPKISLQDTLSDMLDNWRMLIKNNKPDRKD